MAPRKKRRIERRLLHGQKMHQGHTFPALDLSRKWRNLTLLAIAELLAMGLWFSASAVLPQLLREWQLGSAGQ